MTIHRTAGWENVWLSLVNQKKQSNHVELSEYRYVSHSHSVLKMKASKLSENLSYQVGIDFVFKNNVFKNLRRYFTSPDSDKSFDLQ